MKSRRNTFTGGRLGINNKDLHSLRDVQYSLNILGSFPIAMFLRAPPKFLPPPEGGPYTEVLQVFLGNPASFGTQYQGSVVEVVSSAFLCLVQRWIMTFLWAARRCRAFIRLLQGRTAKGGSVLVVAKIVMSLQIAFACCNSISSTHMSCWVDVDRTIPASYRRPTNKVNRSRVG